MFLRCDDKQSTKRSIIFFITFVVLIGAGVIKNTNAQSLVYGQMDIGVIKERGKNFTVGRGDNNILGFRGSEDLGGGLAAIYRIEIRFEPDIGTTESFGRRPLFQGRSYIGFKGDWGRFRIGRDLTSMQDPIVEYDPFIFQTTASLDAVLGNYFSDPTYEGSSGNRFSNALFYETPELAGLQAWFSVATKEGNTAGIANPDFRVLPWSFALTWDGGNTKGMVGYERNPVDDTFWNVAALRQFGGWYGTIAYSEFQPKVGNKERGFAVGGSIDLKTGFLKFGYGRIKPDNLAANKQISLGYWYNFSKRTQLYTDITRRKFGSGLAVVGADLGIHHQY